MRITEAARRLDMTPRMLRYRESLGLLPPLRPAVRRAAAGRLGAGRPAVGRPAVGRPATGRHRAQPAAGAPDALPGLHRQFTDADLAAVALGVSLERRYDISPAALAFGIRVLADPRVRADVAELGRRVGRIQPPPARALDFEQERAQRLLRLGESAPLPPAGARRVSPQSRQRPGG
jgi:MerR family copper efflux transcriptional regulator